MNAAAPADWAAAAATTGRRGETAAQRQIDLMREVALH